jgi:hypothetical protein
MAKTYYRASFSVGSSALQGGHTCLGVYVRDVTCLVTLFYFSFTFVRYVLSPAGKLGLPDRIGSKVNKFRAIAGR